MSLGTLKEVIKLNDLKSVEEITEYTKAGAFCKSCIKPGGHEEREYYLVDILRDVRAEMEEESLKNKADLESKGDLKFADMTLVQKIKAIESLIDEKIRPMLMMDGGIWRSSSLKILAMDILMFISAILVRAVAVLAVRQERFLPLNQFCKKGLILVFAFSLCEK